MAGEAFSIGRRCQLWAYIKPLEDAGYDPRRVLATTGTSKWLDGAPLDWVPTDVFSEAIDTCAQRLGDELYGFEVAGNVTPTALPVIGRYIGASATLFESFNTLGRLIKFHTPSFEFWLTENEHEVWVCGRNPKQTNLLIEQYTILMLIKLARMGLGPAWRPSKICIHGSDASHIESHPAFADVTILRGRGLRGFAISKSALPELLPQEEASLVQDMEERLGPNPPSDLLASLQAVIASSLSAGALSMEDAAEFAGLSSRTLSRRLIEQGTSYRKQVETVRFRQAKQLLENDVPIREIARTVGYSNTPAFYHGFKNLAGVTPAAYRRQILQNSI